MANDANPELAALFNSAQASNANNVLSEESINKIYSSTEQGKMEALSERAIQKEQTLGLSTINFDYDPSKDPYGLKALEAKKKAAALINVDVSAFDGMSGADAIGLAQARLRDEQYLLDPEGQTNPEWVPETQYGKDELFLRDTYEDPVARDIERQKMNYVSDERKNRESGTWENLIDGISLGAARIANSAFSGLGEMDNSLGHAFQMASVGTNEWEKDAEAQYNRDYLAQQEANTAHKLRQNIDNGDYFSFAAEALTFGLDPRNMANYILENVPEYAASIHPALAAGRLATIINDNLNESKQAYINKHGKPPEGREDFERQVLSTVAGVADFFGDRLVGKRLGTDISKMFNGAANTVKAAVNPLVQRGVRAVTSGAGEFIAESSAYTIQELAKGESPDGVQATMQGLAGLGAGAGTTIAGQVASDTVTGQGKQLFKNIGTSVKDNATLRHASEHTREMVDANRESIGALSELADSEKFSEEDLDLVDSEINKAADSFEDLESEKLDLIIELESTEDPQKQKEIEQQLEAIMVAQKEIGQIADATMEIALKNPEVLLIAQQESLIESIAAHEQSIAQGDDSAETKEALAEAKKELATIEKNIEESAKDPESNLSKERIEKLRKIIRSTQSFGSDPEQATKAFEAELNTDPNYTKEDREVFNKSLEASTDLTHEGSKMTQRLAAQFNAITSKDIRKAKKNGDGKLLGYIKQRLEQRLSKTLANQNKNLTGKNQDVDKYPADAQILQSLIDQIDGYDGDITYDGAETTPSIRKHRSQFDPRKYNKLKASTISQENAERFNVSGFSRNRNRGGNPDNKSGKNAGSRANRSGNNVANNPTMNMPNSTGSSNVKNTTGENNSKINKFFNTIKGLKHSKKKGISRHLYSFVDPASGVKVESFVLTTGKSKKGISFINGMQDLPSNLVSVLAERANKGKLKVLRVTESKNGYQAGDIIVRAEVGVRGAKPNYKPLQDDISRGDKGDNVFYEVLRDGEFIDVNNSVNEAAFKDRVRSFEANKKTVDTERKTEEIKEKKEKETKKSFNEKIFAVSAELTEVVLTGDAEALKKFLKKNELIEEATDEAMYEFLEKNFQNLMDSQIKHANSVAYINEQIEKDISNERDPTENRKKLEEAKAALKRIERALGAYRGFYGKHNNKMVVTETHAIKNTGEKNKNFFNTVFDVISNITTKIGSWVLNKEKGTILSSGDTLLNPIKGTQLLINEIAKSKGVKASELSSEELGAIYAFYNFAKQFHETLSKNAISFNPAESGTGQPMNVRGVLDLDQYPIGLFGTTTFDGKSKNAAAGKVSPAITFAMALSSFDWMDSLSTDTTNDLKDSMGVDDINLNNPVHREIARKYQGKVVGKKAARDIGMQVARSLGIEVDLNAPYNINEELYSALGALALSTLAEMRDSKNNAYAIMDNVGIKEFRRDKAKLLGHANNEVEIDESKKVPLFKKGFRKTSSLVEDNLDILSDAFGMMSHKQYPTTNKEKARWVTNRGYLKYLKLPKHTVAKKLLSVGWFIDPEIAKLAIGENGRTKLFELFYGGNLEGIDLKDLGTAEINKIVNQHSINRRDKVRFEIEGLLDEIDTVIDGLKHVAKENSDFSKPVYLSYFSVGQGRFQILTNTLDPQQSKVARKLMKPDLSNVGKEFDLKITKGDNVPNYFYDALGSVVGLSEKNFAADHANYRAYFKEYLNSFTGEQIKELNTLMSQPMTNESLKAVASILNSVETKSEWKPPKKFKGMDAYTVAKDIVEYQSGKPFVTGISMEVDSITSNFAITSFQYPLLNGMISHLHRVGIFDSKDATAHSFFGDGSNQDSYVAMGERLEWNVFAIINRIKPSELQDFKTGNAAVGAPNYGLAQEFSRMLAFIGDAHADLSKGIANAVRDVFKYPFMTTNYLQGFKGTVNLAKESITDLVSKRIDDIIQDSDTVEELEAAVKLFNEQFAPLGLKFTFGKNGKAKSLKVDTTKTAHEVKEQLRKAKLYESKKYNQFINTISEAVAASAFEILGDSIGKRKLVNSTFHMQYEVYIASVREAVNKIKPRERTQERVQEALDSVAHLLPSFEGPRNDGKDGTVRYPAFKAKAVTASPKVDLARKDGTKSITSTQVEFVFSNNQRSLTVSLNSREIQDVGVGSQALMTQSLESAVMALTAQESVEGVLHVHDATKGHAVLLAASGLHLNGTFYEESRDYDMVGDSLDSLSRSLRAAHAAGLFDTDPSKPYTRKTAVTILAAMMKSRIEAEGTTSYDMEKYLKEANGDYREAAKAYLQDLNELHSFTTSARNLMFPHEETTADENGKTKTVIKEGLVKVIDNFTGPVEGTAYTVDQTIPVKNRTIDEVTYGKPSKTMPDPVNPEKRISIKKAVEDKFTKSKPVTRVEVTEETSSSLGSALTTIKESLSGIGERIGHSLHLEDSTDVSNAFDAAIRDFSNTKIIYKGNSISLQQAVTKNGFPKLILTAFMDHIKTKNAPLYYMILQTDVARNLTIDADALGISKSQADAIASALRNSYYTPSTINLKDVKDRAKALEYLAKFNMPSLINLRTKLQEKIDYYDNAQMPAIKRDSLQDPIRKKLDVVNEAIRAKKPTNAAALARLTNIQDEREVYPTIGAAVRYLNLTDTTKYSAVNAFLGLHKFVEGVSSIQEAQRVRNSLSKILLDIKDMKSDGAKVAKSEIKKAIKTLDKAFRTEQAKRIFAALADNKNFRQIQAFVKSLKTNEDREAAIQLIDETGLTKKEKNTLKVDLTLINNEKNSFFGNDPDVTPDSFDEMLADVGNGTEVSVINESTVSEVFDNVSEADNQDISESHNEHLRHVLTRLVKGGLGQVGDVNLFLGRIEQALNSGRYYESDGEKFILIGRGDYKGPINMSAREILVHELIHAITLGIFNNPTEVATAISIRDTFLENTDRDTVVLALANGDTSPEAMEIANARYDYMFHNNEVINGVPSGLAEFMAYMMTNEGIYTLGKTIKHTHLNSHGLKGNTFSAKVLNWIVAKLNKMINVVLGNTTADVHNKSVYQAMYNLIASNQDSLKTANKGAVATLTKPIFNAAAAISKHQNKVNDRLVEKLDKVMNTTANKFIQELKSEIESMDKLGRDPAMRRIVAAKLAVTIGSMRKLSDEKIALLSVQLESKFAADGTGTVNMIISKLIDTAADIADDYNIPTDTTSNIRTLLESLLPSEIMYDYEDVHRTYRHEVDNVATTKEAAGIEAVRNSETVKKTKGQEQQITKLLLRTDLASLLGEDSIGAVKKYFFNDAYRQGTINNLEEEIADLMDNYPDVLKGIMGQANGLVNYMQDPTFSGRNQLRNVEAIVYMNIYPHKHMSTEYRDRAISGKQDQLIALVDKYVTLKSISASKKNKTNREGMQALIQEENNGSAYFETVLRQTYAANDYIQRNLFSKDNSILQIKGHIPYRSNKNLEIVETTPDEVDSYRKKGYEVLFKDNEGFVTMARENSRQGTITMGLLTGIRDESSGKSITDRMYKQRSIPKDEALAMLQDEESQAAYEEQVLGIVKDDKKSRKVPIYDNQGIIVDYNNTVSNYAKEKLLGAETEVTAMVGAKLGSSHRKSAKKIGAKDTVEFIVSDYKKHFKTDPSAFIRINGDTYDKFGRKNPYKDMYALVQTEYMDEFRKAGINTNKGIPVRKSTINAVLGFKKMNAVDSKPIEYLQALAPNVPIRKWLVGIDDLIKEFTAIRKVQIVLKEPAVIFGNFISAFTLLNLYGVDPDYMMKDMLQGFKEINAYKTYIKEIYAIENELATIRNPQKRKQLEQRHIEISAVMGKLESMELIEAGMYSMMAEDINISSNGLFESTMKDLREKHDILDKAGNVVDTVYVNKGTPTFELLSNLTQFTDFAGRFALYKHFKREGKLSNTEIKRKISDAFIYYDMPDGRILEGMNSYGLLMFTKFHVRIQRVLLDLLKTKPLNVASQGLIEYMVTDIENILNQVVTNKNYGAVVNLPTDHIREALDPAMFRWIRALLTD